MPKLPPSPLTGMINHVASAIETCPDMPRFLQILGRVMTAGLWHDRFVVARAIAFCATTISASGGLHLAGLLFHLAEDPTAFAYNAMIRGHSAGPTPSESIRLFRHMLDRGIYPDKFAFPFLLRACARAGPLFARGEGEQYHPLLLKHGLERDPHVQTSLLRMYAALGRIDSTRRVFDEMPERGTVTWNAIISSYARTSDTPEEGLSLLGEMGRAGLVEANEGTLVAALSCCAGLGVLGHGKSVHGFVTRRHVDNWSVEMGSSLVHMYVKCGSVDRGARVFERMCVRDVSSWTTMIGGLAAHGRGAEALCLFERMVVVEGMRPDSVTFTSVLHACSHSGLVKEGLKVFNDMKVEYGVEPRVEHFGAVVDLLGRSGRLEEAKLVAESMPFPPNRVILSSLLHACMVDDRDQVGSGEENLLGKQHILKESLEGVESSFCVGASNVYAKVGRWEEVGRVREMMVERGVRKAIGYSLVEVNGRLHKFLVGDTRHPLAMDIYGLLGGIMAQELMFA